VGAVRNQRCRGRLNTSRHTDKTLTEEGLQLHP
jgi:hypothetical protein